MDLKAIEKVTLTIAGETGALLRDGFRQAKEIAFKSSAIDLVTEYDTQAEKVITDELARSFPTHHICAEESAAGSAEAKREEGTFTWFIDPIDGTGNFAHGFPHFVTSLGLYRGDEPLVGVVYDPLRDEYFHATRGGGAWLTNGEGETFPLEVSSAAELVRSLLVTGFPYDRHSSEQDNLVEFAAFLKRARGLRRTGAAALDLAYVAAGRLDGYWEYKLNSWDVAAGTLLVTEAGGRVSGIGGDPFSLTRKVDLIASNGHIHRPMVEVLAACNGQKTG